MKDNWSGISKTETSNDLGKYLSDKPTLTDHLKESSDRWKEILEEETRISREDAFDRARPRHH